MPLAWIFISGALHTCMPLCPNIYVYTVVYTLIIRTLFSQKESLHTPCAANIVMLCLPNLHQFDKLSWNKIVGLVGLAPIPTSSLQSSRIREMNRSSLARYGDY